MIAPRIRFAVRDDIKCQFTFGGFNATIRFPGRDPDLIRWFLRIDRPQGNLLDGLLQYPQGLPNLINTNEVIIHQVTAVAHSYVEFETVVNPIGFRAANI